jgi:hypothetical protein
MPYIITTGSKYRKDHSLECWPLPRGGSAPERCNCDFMDGFTRTAVATLDEARDDVIARIECAENPDGPRLDSEWERAHGMDESGGTVGPLPDGTVIEVRRVEWATLNGEHGYTLHPSTQMAERILAAYNA